MVNIQNNHYFTLYFLTTFKNNSQILENERHSVAMVTPITNVKLDSSELFVYVKQIYVTVDHQRRITCSRYDEC